MTSLEQAKTIVKVLDKKKGKDIKLVEIKNLSSLGDYFVNCVRDQAPHR